jgi:homoserine kinase type II
MEPVQSAAYAEISEVLAHYNLGQLVQYKQNLLGYNNTNFAIKTEKQEQEKDYFFRRYKQEILVDEITFEHAIIEHLLSQDVCQVARVHRTKNGETYVSRQLDGMSLPVYYAVFDFLEGEDRYTWIDPQLSTLEVQAAAAVLANFHNAVAAFNPPGRRVEPKILDLLPQIAENLQLVTRYSKGTDFDAALADNLDALLEVCSDMKAYCAGVDWSAAPEMVIHCDYHPGNLKFSGEQVVGLFDFDWSKIDLRCFDVGLAIWYLSHWRGDLDGIVRLDESLQFLRTYQGVLAGMADLDPLSEFELQHLPVMINLGNLFVLNWTVTDYYATSADPEEYLVYLNHSIRFCHWFAKRGRQFLLDHLVSSGNELS